MLSKVEGYKSDICYGHINEIFGGDLYFLIRPLKVEVASPEPHSILVIHNMISDEEADSLIEQVIVKGIVNLVDFPSAKECVP